MSFHCCTGCDASLTSVTHTAGASPSLGEWYLTLHGVALLTPSPPPPVSAHAPGEGGKEIGIRDT